MKRCCFLLLFTLTVGLCAGQGKQDGERMTFQKTVYMFGIAQSYMDSVTYVTNVDRVENVVFDKGTGYVDGLDLYTTQLETYLLQQGHAGYVCTTFYATDRKKAEKRFLKIKRRMLRQKYTQVQNLGDFAYRFVSTENIYRNMPKQGRSDDDAEEKQSNQ